MEHLWWPNACNDTNEWKLLDLPHNMRNVTDRRLGALCQNLRSLALTVWEWRWRDTAVRRILRIKHPRLLLMARPEGRYKHSWAQRFIHVEAAVYMHDHLGPWVFFYMLWGMYKSCHSFVSLHALGHHGCSMFSVEEVPQNMFCISSATDNIIMEVPQKILI